MILEILEISEMPSTTSSAVDDRRMSIGSNLSHQKMMSLGLIPQGKRHSVAYEQPLMFNRPFGS